MNLNKEDVERIVKTMLMEELTLNVVFKSPNSHSIQLVLGREVISEVYIHAQGVKDD